MTDYTFVNVNAFTPNIPGYWSQIGNIASTSRSGNAWTLTAAQNGVSLLLSFLGPTCFRVRFSPVPGASYAAEPSAAVVTLDLGPVTLTVVQDDAQALVVDTGEMRVAVALQPFAVSVYRGGQLIHQDAPGQGIVFIPGQQVTACFKTFPAGARYVGFGEKAGAQLVKNQFTMTQFNFDNYKYVTGPLPQGWGAGPLNPAEPLYCSIPLLIELNPQPSGAMAGAPYAYGIFFDNPGQTFFNVGANDYSDMAGKYYFGALYGDLDYYFMAGGGAPDVLAQYTTLTGRAPMPPRYVLGFHQGAYGYFDRYKLAAAANGYRAARIPCDGLHIDVDFQDNYRTFTHSEMKFPNCREMMDDLHGIGFKCSTNITPLLTDNVLDENGEITPYAQRDALLAVNGLIYDTRAGQGPSPDLFRGQVSYGFNMGNNPYPYPPLTANAQGNVPLTAFGGYSDYGRADVRQAWGEQYAHLVNDLGMDMIWQDMTCPALAGTSDTPWKTFPLDQMQNDGAAGYQPNAVFHNAYVLNLLSATWEGLAALRPGRRNFIIARGGYAGMQRYAGLWTGDSASSWDFLGINIPQVLNLGLSGVPISGTDIGGFATGDGTTSGASVVDGQVVGGITNYELLTRWMQLGSFLPWYRNHYDGYSKQFQEPFAYGEPVPGNCRAYLELRYRMLQVYYDAMWEWTQTGMPVARALFLNDPGDPGVYEHLDDQFFVGRDFLVAPVLTQGWSLTPPQPTSRSVYLPAGSQWYAFKDNQYPLDAPVDGGTLIGSWTADLSQVPLYVRAGAILPFRELEQWVGQLAQNPLTFNIYPGPDSSYTLYQDDGITTQAQDAGTYRVTQVSHQGVEGGQNVRVQRVHDAYAPPEPFYYVALLGTRHPSSVSAAGAALADVGDPASLAASPVSAYYWNSGIQVTFVKVFDTAPDVTVTALYF
ncbi:MAG TPA: TIM-barrel domain-containing protein [Longimicrobium sp.]|nr:TIM-barrel domain-containing protein [Longimicrobium sp.]